MADLSSLLASSRSLNSQLSRPELPQVHLSLDQIEAQSRRLVSRQTQPGNADDANYLLAQAQINTANLSSSVAHLNTTAATTFTPLQALQDTDLAGYLRAAHEQTLISTIEESRKQTQNDFYQMLSDRMNKDWENTKTRIWEELYSGSAPPTRRTVLPSTSALPTPTLSLQMQTKMMAYDRVITDLNNARLKGSPFPVLHRLIDASTSLSTDVRYLLPFCVILQCCLATNISRCTSYAGSHNFRAICPPSSRPRKRQHPECTCSPGKVCSSIRFTEYKFKIIH